MESLKSHEYMEEEYPKEEMNIRVSVQRDEDSEPMPKEEAAEIKKEIEELKEKLADIGEG